jgi:hypothetical protein
MMKRETHLQQDNECAFAPGLARQSDLACIIREGTAESVLGDTRSRKALLVA